MQYKAQTQDGYILTIFRIPSVQTDKAPVFLMHGVQSTSGIFVSLGQDSLGTDKLLLIEKLIISSLVLLIAAFMLADAGYDVWLGNYRGTEYSEGHTRLNVTQRKFWNYG